MVKNPPANAGDATDASLTPGPGRSHREGNDNLLQNSCLENSMEQRNLVGYSPCVCKESDTTERTARQHHHPDTNCGCAVGWDFYSTLVPVVEEKLLVVNYELLKCKISLQIWLLDYFFFSYVSFLNIFLTSYAFVKLKMHCILTSVCIFHSALGKFTFRNLERGLVMGIRFFT